MRRAEPTVMSFSICLSGMPWYRLTPTVPPVSATLTSATSNAYTATPARRVDQIPLMLQRRAAERPSLLTRSTTASSPETQTAEIS